MPRVRSERLWSAVVTIAQAVEGSEAAQASRGKRRGWGGGILAGARLTNTQAKLVVTLYLSLRDPTDPDHWPDPEEFERAVLAVHAAALNSPAEIFARHLRWEGWEGKDGSRRPHQLRVICDPEKFAERLAIASEWMGDTAPEDMGQHAEAAKAAREALARLPKIRAAGWANDLQKIPLITRPGHPGRGDNEREAWAFTQAWRQVKDWEGRPADWQAAYVQAWIEGPPTDEEAA